MEPTYKIIGTDNSGVDYLEEDYYRVDFDSDKEINLIFDYKIYVKEVKKELIDNPSKIKKLFPEYLKIKLQGGSDKTGTYLMIYLHDYDLLSKYGKLEVKYNDLIIDKLIN